ncbi:MAG: hypothetical protein ACFCD0_17125 [Gemmataceae bacterium]
MAQTCSRCSRVNPDEAQYCFFDGALLNGAQAGGAVHPGQRPFSHPFVFPSGEQCQNFDQFAMRCQQYWEDALELLINGTFERFLGGQGRVDLAMVAKTGANSADKDRGLDQLLSHLPTEALPDPKLHLEPTEINLGELKPGKDESLTIFIENHGGRLLCGSIESNSPWLTVGDKPGLTKKIFQCPASTTVGVNVRRDLVRASDKPSIGKLVLDSNGGTQTIVFKVRAPIQPFPDGILKGAKSPRELALKARQSPKEAAALFESGAVKNWYKSNGWDYPVRGEGASGVAAVQQFFEALGLVKPPKVRISEHGLTLYGRRGESLQTSFFVFTEAKKYLYAHATPEQPWLQAKTTMVTRMKARVDILASVPLHGQGNIEGRILVASNGNQVFKIPVTINIEPGAPAQNAGRPVVAALPVPNDTTAPVSGEAIAPVVVMPMRAVPIEVVSEDGSGSSQRNPQTTSSPETMKAFPATPIGSGEDSVPAEPVDSFSGSSDQSDRRSPDSFLPAPPPPSKKTGRKKRKGDFSFDYLTDQSSDTTSGAPRVLASPPYPQANSFASMLVWIISLALVAIIIAVTVIVVVL